MPLNTRILASGLFSLPLSTVAFAEQDNIGFDDLIVGTRLAVEDGGLLAVAIVALAIGIRIVRASAKTERILKSRMTLDGAAGAHGANELAADVRAAALTASGL